MTEEEIISFALQKSIDANEILLKKKSDEIGQHDLYKESVKMAEHISYHAVKGKFPTELFKHRSPNQTEKEAKYIEDNYKQHTLPVFIDYISTITRPFGDGNWSIAYKEDKEVYKSTENTFQSYVENELPIYGSLENFVKFILPSIKSIDANGFITVRPKDIDYIPNEEGELVVDGESLYKPTIFYFKSKDVVCYEHNKYYLFLSKEKSVVTFGGKKQQTGSVFELYTKEAVYFIKQFGVKIDNTFEVAEYYRHELGQIPAHQLMGVPNIKGDEILWQSPYLYAVDLLDIVATNANWLQASINKCVYPHVVMFGNICEFKDSDGNQCQGGYLYPEGKKTTCSNCNGQGLTSRLSPLGTLLLAPTTKFEPGEEKSLQDPLRFISPEVHTLEFIEKKVENDTLKARSILHLRNKNSSTVTIGDKTATEVFDDAKATSSFVMPISNQIFTLYEWTSTMIGLQRYGEDFEAPEFSYPKTCDFKSPEDYLVDIGNAIKNNLPPSFIQTILMQYINSYYGDNTKANSIFKLVIQADRLFGLSQDEINMKMAKGTVAKWEDILHTSVLNFINDLIMEDEKFTEKSIEEQIELLHKIAQTKADDISGVDLTDLTGTTLPQDTE